jgi:hypothetical protein
MIMIGIIAESPGRADHRIVMARSVTRTAVRPVPRDRPGHGSSVGPQASRVTVTASPNLCGTPTQPGSCGVTVPGPVSLSGGASTRTQAGPRVTSRPGRFRRPGPVAQAREAAELPRRRLWRLATQSSAGRCHPVTDGHAGAVTVPCQCMTRQKPY